MPQRPRQNNKDITDKSADFEFPPLPKKPSEENAIDYGRRIKWLMAAIFIAIVAYTAAWFWFGNQLVSLTQNAISKSGTRGQTISCSEPSAIGYPFRIGLSCSATVFADLGKGIDLKSGAFRSAAQIYKPDHIIAELDGPLHIAANGVDQLTINWTLARSSIHGIQGIPQRVSTEIEMPTLADANQHQLGSAERIAFHLRQGAGNQIDLASNVEAAKIKAAPVFNLSADAFVSGASRFKAAIASGKPFVEVLRGNDGELRNLVLTFAEGGSVTISGPFSFSDSGLLSATLQLKADKAGDLIDNFAKLGAEFGLVNENLDLLKAMAVSDQINLSITVRDGNAALGFIPIGTIPAL